MSAPRTRILHIINGEFYSGAERVQDLLAAGLAPLGYDVGFALIKPGLFAERRFFAAAPLHDMSMRHKFDIGVAWRLAALVREQNYRIIHTHTPRAALVGALASVISGVPMVHHVHSPTSADTENALRNRLNTLVEDVAIMRARRLLPVSESLAKYLRAKGIAEQRIRMVANGVTVRSGDVPAFPRGTPPVIGVMALFRPRKGMEVFVEALGLLKKKQDVPFRVLAVGAFETPAYEQAIHAAAKSAGVDDLIEWAGFRRDVDKQLDRMDVFALPSTFGEGMPMVVLEAMAGGVPVVASNVEGVPQVIVDGVSGVLTKPGDAQSLADALAGLLKDPEKIRRIGTAGRDRQRDCFSDQSMAKGAAAAYTEVLGER